MAAEKPGYMIHTDGGPRGLEGGMATVQLRVVRIANGWLLKAGTLPRFCQTMDEVRQSIEEILVGFNAHIEAREGQVK